MSEFTNELKWHYTKDNDYPKILNKYITQRYPQIPCLVLRNGMYGVRYWNVTEQCWDDEQCDDYDCAPNEVEKWLYIDLLEAL